MGHIRVMVMYLPTYLGQNERETCAAFVSSSVSLSDASIAGCTACNAIKDESNKPKECTRKHVYFARRSDLEARPK